MHCGACADGRRQRTCSTGSKGRPARPLGAADGPGLIDIMLALSKGAGWAPGFWLAL